ncbi:uncharacterized protein EI97DRAFT_228488 [Westerdykella ornata]|uniref:Uncharacterized protein n=1 Tax=Westerdykella ornata TaxID=318751 RepID=A0A6A6JVS1_WESOR|nr:uncharacterized protein EI97DRAFT_228488 [Westerdykella ornata]KAF2279149.1 hypothetical protein EI97DRAFT_228488 [Westerdykella ornata]
MGIGETITVINKSGKIVSSSRHIIDVFKEAKSAYRERKAEIRAERHAALQQEKKLREGMRALQLQDNNAVDHDDVRSRASSRRSKGTHRSSRSHRHHHHDGEPRRSSNHHHPLRYDYSAYDLDPHNREPAPLTRRHTELPLRHHHPPPYYKPTHSHSEPHIDMDLAYGDLPPPSPTAAYNEEDLHLQASKLTRLLEEAHCLHHSVSTTIDSLQKNPDALAAVALTLAEISNLVGKMGPGVLTFLKGSFPAVAALLASPQFMIAAGVGIGVTIVALGGYKIIKKIQAVPSQGEGPVLEEPWRGAGPVGGGLDQLEELETQELSRIEVWRRGIADVEAESAGTTVDGEFITPGASRHLVAVGVLEEEEVRSRRKSRVGKGEETESRKSHRSKGAKSSAKSSSSSSRSKSTKEKSRKKEPSGLRMLFRSHTAH